MAATIGLLAVLGTATADIFATNDHVNQLRCGTTPEDQKINPRARAAAVAQSINSMMTPLSLYRSTD